MDNHISLRSLILVCGALTLVGCSRPFPGYQGYLEGDFVYVASPLGGRLDKLAVAKGARVEAGAPLFLLERGSERDAQALAAEQLHSAQARRVDLAKGSRPSELASLQAHLDQARAAEDLSGRELGRQEALIRSGAIAPSDYDRARSSHDQDVHAVAQLAAELQTATLGGRSDALVAADADIRGAGAALARAQWNVEQKEQTAPRASLVYDTLYREGEFVAAGNPVVVLLPPENIKVRFFVPEADCAALRAGEEVRVAIDGATPFAAHISYISPQAEYTPPILFNRDNRAKLVFMVEAQCDAATARDLHPGQPVDVTLAH